MRSLMISVVIIMFCFSVEIVNITDSQYYTDTGNRTLFGWNAQVPLNSSDALFDDVRTENMNSSMEKYTTPAEQPPGVVESIWSGITFVISGLPLLVNVLFKSSIGFSGFIQHLGHDEITFVPSYIANILSLFVNFIHLIALIQIVMKWNLKAGA